MGHLGFAAAAAAGFLPSFVSSSFFIIASACARRPAGAVLCHSILGKARAGPPRWTRYIQRNCRYK
jgi:hypothetical protein